MQNPLILTGTLAVLSIVLVAIVGFLFFEKSKK